MRPIRAALPAALSLFFALAPAASGSGLAEDVREIRLDNGLRILVLERPFSPTFAACYQFGVGSVFDPKGSSGIAHLLEHMMFKGTRNVGTVDPGKEEKLMARLSELWTDLQAELARESDPFDEADRVKIESLRAEIKKVGEEQKELIVKNELDEVYTRAGGVGFNASTGWDATNYILQLPMNQLELWFMMEADRLMNPVFREFYSERDVVLEERRLRVDNRASGLAVEAMNRLLYEAHHYGVPVIGWPGDLARLRREDAEDYFRTYYSPGNCVMALVGDVDAGRVEALARKYLGGWERQEIPPLEVTGEPEQRGERRQVVEFDAEPEIHMGWMSVPEGHPDQYALDILSNVLGGMSSSRLDQTMVQRDRVAASVRSYNGSAQYGGDFGVVGRPSDGRTVGEIEEHVLGAIREIQEDGITEEELERAKVFTEVSRVRRLESNMRLARSLADAVRTTGSADYLDEYEARIRAVTAEQVREAAAKYLVPSKLCAVEVRKTEGAPASVERGGDHARGAPPGERGARHSKGFARAMEMMETAGDLAIQIPEIGVDVERVELPSGITVFIKESHDVPAVNMQLRFLGGHNTTPVDDIAPFELASRLLNEGGTESLTPAELDVRKDELGVQFSMWLGSTEGGGSFWSLSRNFDESFGLAVEILARPRLDEDRLEVLKGQYIQGMKRRFDDPGAGVGTLTSHLLTGDHPRLGHVVDRAALEAVTAAEIREAVDRYLGRDNLYVTVVGDFRKDEMLAAIEGSLGAWKTAKDSERLWISREPSVKPGVFVVEKDLPQPAVRIVQEVTVDRTASEEDHAAIEIMNDIFGGSGFRSRLMERLRSDEGLTYGIRSGFFHEGREGTPGGVAISYQTKKESVARSIESVLEELERMRREEVSAAELQEQIQAWRNSFIFRFTSEFFSVSRLMGHELDDRPYDRDQEQLDMIEKVTAGDVLRAAQTYMDPSKVTIAVFGVLTPEDEAALSENYGLTKLSKEEVFKGGYWSEEPVMGAVPE